MREIDYFLYHNPDTMGRPFEEIAQSGCIGTDKETTAEQAAEENGVIWCVGKRIVNKQARYFLYQRIVDARCFYAKPAELAEGAFRISLCGKPTFPADYEKDITDEPYFDEIRKSRIMTFGLQRMGLKQNQTLAAFKAEYERIQL